MGDDDAGGVEEALDALYGAGPEGFVAGRDRLAGELRRAGRRDEARRVAALRRPSLAAWAVDHVALRDQGAVDALVAAGERLRQAQEEVVAGGDRAALHRAAEERRALITSLAAEAAAALAARGSGASAHRDEIEATLEAASADPSVAALVRTGRLTTAVPRPAGFAGLLDLPLRPSPAPPAPAAPEPPAPEPAAPEPPAPAPPAPDVVHRREEAARLARVAAEAAGVAERAGSQLDEALADVDRLERQLAEARARAVAAREEADDARARARAAQDAAGAAAEHEG